MTKLVVLFGNGIGDAILTLPALRAMVDREPDHEITLLESPNNIVVRDVFSQFNICDDVVSCDADRNFSVSEVCQRLSSSEYFVHLNSWDSDSRRKLSEVTSNRIKSVGFWDQPVASLNLDMEHYTDRYMHLSQVLNPSALIDDFSWPQESLSWSLLPKIYTDQAATCEPFCVIHTDTDDHKTFSVNAWGSVIEVLTRELPNHTFFMVGSDAILKLRERIVHSRLIYVPGAFSFSTWLISRAALFIGIDSCFLHYADLQRRPSIAIFRSTSHRKWGLRLTKVGGTIVHAADDGPSLARTVRAAVRKISAAREVLADA
ncbi:glycosyltransferase family 9 protein [Caulobacter sp. BE254]|uniref:glycosyltransferase family 9 protein n=1 Tax=Caulobacter sp. BE254 TaxID=2817720 RepID=UPI0028664241|nr:glycosyltransferase family 9 protein [Caulobacter sp. BE254]MDR7114668.1 ADP-heptose:LPS heptosyltransferase [Caulobacter sp. BE254]